MLFKTSSTNCEPSMTSFLFLHKTHSSAHCAEGGAEGGAGGGGEAVRSKSRPDFWMSFLCKCPKIFFISKLSNILIKEKLTEFRLDESKITWGTSINDVRQLMGGRRFLRHYVKHPFVYKGGGMRVRKYVVYMLWISTSFWVLRSPKSWSIYFF